jgi:hypothetical protein
MAFDVEGVLKQSFIRLFTDRFIFYLALIYGIVGSLFNILILSMNISPSSPINISLPQSELYQIILYLIIFIVFSMFMGELAFLRIYDSKTDTYNIIKKAILRFPSFFATSILSGVIVVLGLIAFIVPGIYFAFKFALAPVSAVVEGKSPLDALKRSWDVSDENWWYLFAFFAIIGIVLLLINFIPYISYFFNFAAVISYPLVFLAVIPKQKRKRKKARNLHRKRL